MLMSCEKLRDLAEGVEPVSKMVILKFLNEAEAHVVAEIEAAKKCLRDYGVTSIDE